MQKSNVSEKSTLPFCVWKLAFVKSGHIWTISCLVNLYGKRFKKSHDLYNMYVHTVFTWIVAQGYYYFLTQNKDKVL